MLTYLQLHIKNIKWNSCQYTNIFFEENAFENVKNPSVHVPVCYEI